MVGSGCKNHPLPCASEAAARLPGVDACQRWILALPLLFLCQQCHPGPLVPPRKRKPESKHAAANLPHVSTWSVEEAERAPNPRLSAAEGREIRVGGRDAGGPLRRTKELGPRREDGIAGRGYRCDVKKLSTAATQSALRVGRALEDDAWPEEIRYRAPAIGGEAEAHRP